MPMTRATALSASRFLLLPEAERPGQGGHGRAVRRYRLARLKLDSRDTHDRFAHIKRAYD